MLKLFVLKINCAIIYLTVEVRLKKGRYKHLKITDIRVRLVNNNDKLKAVASITIDDELVVHDIKVINGKDGYFLSMPSRKTNDEENKFKDIVHPIKTEVREKLKELILAEYEKALANEQN